ncbi:MAG: hypothetical protein LBC04_00685 [Holosporaceae bacterium]|jgi:hypothetical protein|nr:hypothetical protein [Holosporaceae bacterium]
MSCKHIVAALGFALGAISLISNASSMEVIRHKPGDAFPAGQEKSERALSFFRRGGYRGAEEQLLEIKGAEPLVISSEEELDIIKGAIVSDSPIQQLLLKGLDIDVLKEKLSYLMYTKLPQLRQLHLENCRKTEDNPFGDSFYKAGEGLYNSRYRLPPH